MGDQNFEINNNYHFNHNNNVNQVQDNHLQQANLNNIANFEQENDFQFYFILDEVEDPQNRITQDVDKSDFILFQIQQELFFMNIKYRRKKIFFP